MEFEDLVKAQIEKITLENINKQIDAQEFYWGLDSLNRQDNDIIFISPDFPVRLKENCHGKSIFFKKIMKKSQSILYFLISFLNSRALFPVHSFSKFQNAGL